MQEIKKLITCQFLNYLKKHLNSNFAANKNNNIIIYYIKKENRNIL